MSSNVRPTPFAALALVGAILAAAPAAGQSIDPVPVPVIKVNFFPSKFVCGFQRGNVPLLNDPNPVLNPYYEHVKPGNYATTFNVLNLNLDHQTISFYVSEPDVYDGLKFVGSRWIPSFGTTQFGCPDIAAGLGTQNGSFFEGYLLIVVKNDQFKVTGVYTFESQNAFERHVLWRLRSDGSSGIESELTSDSLTALTRPLGPVDFIGPFKDIAASGAGGLGLGASIDVEWMKLHMVDVPVDGNPMPIREDVVEPAPISP